MTLKKYATRKQVLQRFGNISAVTLWRWERNERLGFPTPTEINGRKFYDFAEIEAWERARSATIQCDPV